MDTRCNPLLLLGTVLDLALAFLVCAELPVLGLVLAGFALLGVLGTALVAFGKCRPGALLATIGGAAFVPLGGIAILGARLVLDRLAERELERRRTLSGEPS